MCDLFGKDPNLGGIVLLQASSMRANLRGASSGENLGSVKMSGQLSTAV